MSGPLSGLRVLDLSRVLAGPYCTQLLGDLGADVVKVEPPWGDETRQWGPPFLPDGQGTAYFASVNRNKRSAVLDLKTPEGLAATRRLAGRADVLVENFKVGDLEALGLGYAALAELAPRLVYCSITGFGQDGPRAHEPGYDFLIQAMSGLMSVTGPKGGQPHKVGVALVDVLTGLHAATAILAALRERDHSGRGQHIDVALFDVALASLVNQAQGFLATQAPPERLGNAHPSIVPYETFATRDGVLALAIGNDAQFRRFCGAAGVPELAQEARFATNPARVANREALLAQLRTLIGARPTAEWLRCCAAAEVPAGPVNDVAAAFAEPQATARGMRVVHEGLALVGSPLKLSRSAASLRRGPPRLGEHTAEVLAEL